MDDCVPSRTGLGVNPEPGSGHEWSGSGRRAPVKSFTATRRPAREVGGEGATMADLGILLLAVALAALVAVRGPGTSAGTTRTTQTTTRSR